MPEDPDKTALGFAGLNSLASRIDVRALEEEGNVQLRAARFTRFPRSYAGLWRGVYRILLILTLTPTIGFVVSLIAIAVIALFDGNSQPAPKAPPELRARPARATNCLLERPSASALAGQPGQPGQASDCRFDGSNLPEIIECPANGAPTSHHEPCVIHPDGAPPTH